MPIIYTSIDEDDHSFPLQSDWIFEAILWFESINENETKEAIEAMKNAINTIQKNIPKMQVGLIVRANNE